MIFNKVLGDETNRNKKSVYHRETVRAIVYDNNMLLMIKTNQGDCKFPGGGIDENESHQEAVIRELLEETGYRAKMVGNLVGLMVEQKPDKYNSDMLFEMNSYYYLCDITGIKEKQKLDNSEAKLEFKPIWISVDDAISVNEYFLEIDNFKNPNISSCVYRDLYVLKALKNYLENNEE